MAVKKDIKKKKNKANLASNGEGEVHIFANSNNTLVTLSVQGNAVAQCSAGALGNRGAKKTTPFAAQEAVEKCLENASKFGITKVAIYVKGAGVARESAIRAVGTAGLQVTMIKDVSPIPHNGCRPPKRRRL